MQAHQGKGADICVQDKYPLNIMNVENDMGRNMPVITHSIQVLFHRCSYLTAPGKTTHGETDNLQFYILFINHLVKILQSLQIC